jgi:lysophospholipase L1-like esterase
MGARFQGARGQYSAWDSGVEFHRPVIRPYFLEVHAMTRYYSRPFMLGAVLIAALGLPFSASAADSYYLSLGDSLAAGVQPPPVSKNQGYADQLQAMIPNLQLMKLGCYTDESTYAMINGGHCYHAGASQLDTAVAFLQTHNVALITIDIGANDVLPCAKSGFDTTCVTSGLTSIQQNLPIILTKLRAAAGKDVPIIGMNYYDPYIATYIIGDPTFAATLPGFGQINDTLEMIYRAAKSPVADVAGAFSTTDSKTLVLSPNFGTIPLDVARVCQWTWMCDPTSINANFGIPVYIHPNNTGYGIIAGSFYQVLPSSVRK